MDESFKDYINLIENNKIKKESEISAINNFKNIYDIINRYEPQKYTCDEIIDDSDRRLEFLIHSVNIALTNRNMDQNSAEIVLQMFETIYNYLYKESDLKEIEIPNNLKENLFNRMFMPNSSQLMFAITLLKENKRIFNTEFDGKDFSQTIDQGLHTNITEVLKIERNNLPHLLGLTNDGSLYEFYRKVFINSKITEIIRTLDIKDPSNKTFDKRAFNQKFKDFFGLDYSMDNYIKLINWRYNAKDDYLQKKGIVVTEIERELLNKTCDFTPKSRTLDFYCNENMTNLLIKENSKVVEFVYEYIRNKIIEKSNNKKGINELKRILNEDELKQLLDKGLTINKKIIDKYVEQKKYKFEDDKIFKESFINKFGYSYPLINYNELISKNISFYNFSLFKNINSIIVDYDSSGKKIESNVFLVSYAKKKITSIKEKVRELISNKDKKYDDAITSNLIDQDLDSLYIMNLKSLLSFPVEDRYYFRFGFIANDKRKQDDKVIEENTEKNDNITLIGFKSASEEEKSRLSRMEVGEMSKIEHHLTCETNITLNYYQYITDFARRGVEYPIDMLVENGDDKLGRKSRILKMSNPMDRLNQYIKVFNYNNYYNNIDYKESEKYEKLLIDNICNIMCEYKELKETKIKIMQCKLNKLKTKKLDRNDIIKYESDINNEVNKLNEITFYYDNVKLYFNEYENYFKEKNNQDIIKENNIINIDNHKRR